MGLLIALFGEQATIQFVSMSIGMGRQYHTCYVPDRNYHHHYEFHPDLGVEVAQIVR